jgi:choline dehydrogenase-like flavoprotein
MPPLPLGRSGMRFAHAMNKLGWHWWPSDTAVATTEWDGRAPCINLGHCTPACTQGAKASTDITYWPHAIRAGVELRTRCRVREITVDEMGRARGALYYDADGRLVEQRAPLVVMACNGVGTPRILLSSRSRQFPDGLANRSGLVGKNLMFHPFATALGVHPDGLDSYAGPVGNNLMSHEFYETDERRGFVRGFQLQVIRQSGPLHTALGGISAQPAPWGQDHHAEMAARFNHLIPVGVMGEDLPETINEVALDPTLTDGDGVPAPLVRYRLSENSKRMMAFGVERAREALEAAGCSRVLVRNPLRPSGWHLLGTCRMGDAPYGSVVDRWGRSHDVPNLFVVDGSVFVTSAAVNPTTTIQALALRTADHIKRGSTGTS